MHIVHSNENHGFFLRLQSRQDLHQQLLVAAVARLRMNSKVRVH